MRTSLRRAARVGVYVACAAVLTVLSGFVGAVSICLNGNTTRIQYHNIIVYETMSFAARYEYAYSAIWIVSPGNASRSITVDAPWRLGREPRSVYSTGFPWHCFRVQSDRQNVGPLFIIPFRDRQIVVPLRVDLQKLVANCTFYTLFPCLWCAYAAILRSLRKKHGQCTRCGYPRGVGQRCPECGEVSVPETPSGTQSGLAPPCHTDDAARPPSVQR